MKNITSTACCESRSTATSKLVHIDFLLILAYFDLSLYFLFLADMSDDSIEDLEGK